MTGAGGPNEPEHDAAALLRRPISTNAAAAILRWHLRLADFQVLKGWHWGDLSRAFTVSSNRCGKYPRQLLSPLDGVPACGLEHGTDGGKQNPPALSIARTDKQSGRQSLRITLGPLRRDILGNARHRDRSCHVRPLTKSCTHFFRKASTLQGPAPAKDR
jgi:hypothetical protein